MSNRAKPESEMKQLEQRRIDAERKLHYLSDRIGSEFTRLTDELTNSYDDIIARLRDEIDTLKAGL